ncbi:DUF680 domain-containing protein [Mesorhizobium sp. BHscii]
MSNEKADYDHIVVAAVALATGSAFAGSDHYGSDRVNQPAAPVGPTTSAPDDNILTGSIRTLFTAGQGNGTTTEQTQSGSPESGQAVRGRR